MGPGHPAFAGRGGAGSGRGPAPPPGLPPGARWDPIAPEGLPGFRPGDFQRAPGEGRFGEPHPDVEFMPGRGQDFPGGPGFGPGGPGGFGGSGAPGGFGAGGLGPSAEVEASS